MSYSNNMEILNQPLRQQLLERQLTLVTAESCTGGLIGHMLTEAAGSSAYFLGGILAYSNAVKVEQLQVPLAVIEQHGAVSEPCARAMAEGARKLLNADLSVSVTGIAGPGGGTAEKPCGLVFCAVAGARGTIVSRNIWTGNRSENKQASAAEALRLVFSYLQDDADI